MRLRHCYARQDEDRKEAPLGGGGKGLVIPYPFNFFLEIFHIHLIVQALSRKLRVEYPRISFSNIPYR